MIRLILSYLTFPGIILHEFAHAWACRRMGVAIVKICYLRIGNPLGYVLHERPAYAIQHIVIAAAPFFVSTCSALIVSTLAGLLLFSPVVADPHDLLMSLALWLSFSIALHAFPSRGDADALWDDISRPDIGFGAKLLIVPVVGLIRLTGLGARVWLDVLYALLVVVLPPLLLLSFRD